MDTKDLVNIKKQRIREELEKLVPPGFYLQPHPKVRKPEVYDKLDEFLGIDEDLSRQVGYLNATNKGYDEALQNLRFFGLKLKDYKDVVNTGPFYNAPEMNKNIEESADYIIRFYNLARLTIKRINDEEDVRLKLQQNQRQKEQQELDKTKEKKNKASGFISGATKFRPGTTAKINVTKLPGIIPKRTVPQEIVDKISKPQLEVSESEEGISGTKRVVSSLGRLALSLEQSSDNLEKVFEVISNDIANTRELNRKEVDEYRKRVANRGRRIGRRELGDNKVDVSGVVKKYVGSFFSGTGGAIRALALFNMLEQFMNGNPLGAIGPLLGIGATYLPAIGGMIAGMIGKKVLGGLLGAGKGATRSAVRPSGPVSVGRGFGKLGKFGAIAALGASALSLGTGLLQDKKEQEPSTQQQRLDELEAQQKGSVQPENLGAIPEISLKKFEALNLKFEKALDFLLQKQKEGGRTQTRRGGAGGTFRPPGETTPPEIGQITGDQAEVESKMFDYLKQNYGENVAYGMLSNAMRESGYRTNAPEGGFQGMFQWDANRWNNLTNWANSQGLDPMDRATQLRFAVKEAEESGTLRRMKSSKSPEEASSIFYNEFERGAYSKPVVGESNYDPQNPHEKKNLDFLRGIIQRQSQRPPTLPPPPPRITPPKPKDREVSSVPRMTPNIVALGIPGATQEQVPLSAATEGNDTISSVTTNFSGNIHRIRAGLEFQLV